MNRDAHVPATPSPRVLTLATHVPYAESVEACLAVARKRLADLVQVPDEWEVKSADLRRWKPRHKVVFGVTGTVVFAQVTTQQRDPMHPDGDAEPATAHRGPAEEGSEAARAADGTVEA